MTTIHEDNGGVSSHLCPLLDCLTNQRGDSQTTHAIILTDTISLLQKVKSGMGSPDCYICQCLASTFESSRGCMYSLGYSRVKENDPTDRLAGKATSTCVLLVSRSDVLRSLRHYLQAQSQGHHTIDRLEERGVERGSASRRSSLKGRERAIVNQTNI